MTPLSLVYSEGYYLPIGRHVFPADKYRVARAADQSPAWHGRKIS